MLICRVDLAAVQRELAVALAGQHGVVPVTGVGVFQPAQIEKGQRILVDEQRVARQIDEPASPVERALPVIPHAGGDGVRRRADRQHVQQQAFVEVIPGCIEEAAVRHPAHAHHAPAAAHPVPVDVLVQRARQRLHLAAEVLPGHQRAGGQQRRVDGRQLAVPHALTGLHVDEVVEETALALHAAADKAAQRQPGARLAGVGADPAAFHRDRQGGQAEAGGSDAGDGSRRAAIAHQPVDRIDLRPEVVERLPRDFGGQRVIVQRQQGLCLTLEARVVWRVVRGGGIQQADRADVERLGEGGFRAAALAEERQIEHVAAGGVQLAQRGGQGEAHAHPSRCAAGAAEQPVHPRPAPGDIAQAEEEHVGVARAARRQIDLHLQRAVLAPGLQRFAADGECELGLVGAAARRDHQRGLAVCRAIGEAGAAVVVIQRARLQRGPRLPERRVHLRHDAQAGQARQQHSQSSDPQHSHGVASVPAG